MGGVLKNEFKKLFARPEVTVAVVLAFVLPLLISILFTLGEAQDRAKFEDLPDNYYANRIQTCQRRLETENSPEGSERPGEGGTLSADDIAKIRAEMGLCELLQEKQVFSTKAWQYSLLELSLAAGFEEDAYQAIRRDDFNFYYDKMIGLSSGPRKELFQKLKSLEVYPSFSDHRYLLALRVSETADTAEDKLLIFRIENDIPEKYPERSYGSFTGKVPTVLIPVSAIFCSFTAACVFAEDRKNRVPHPSAVIPGAGKVIAAKALALIILLPLTVLASFAAALSVGRLIFEGSLPREAAVNASGVITVKPFFEIVTMQILKLFGMTCASGAVSGLLSYFFRSEIAGIAAGGVLALLSLILTL